MAMVASSRLLLPSSAALFQSPPFPQILPFSDRCRNVTPHSVLSRSLVMHAQAPLDSTLTVSVSSNGEDARSFDGKVTSSDAEDKCKEGEEAEEETQATLDSTRTVSVSNNGEDARNFDGKVTSSDAKDEYREEEEAEAEAGEETQETQETLDSTLTVTVCSNGKDARTFGGKVTSSDAEDEYREEEEAEEEEDEDEKEEERIASEPDVRGTMSKYIWSRPRIKRPTVPREERMKTVHYLLNCQSSFPVELDKARFRLAPSDFGHLLGQCVQGRQWNKARLLFDWMKVNKMLRPQSLSVYITLMGKAGFCYRALRAYNELTDKDLKLNKYVTNSLLKGLIDAGSLSKAFVLFEKLKSDGFTPDEYSYSTVIAGCSKRPSTFRKAKKLMEEMMSSGLRPDKFIYSSMVNVYTRSGHEDEAEALIKEMQDNGIKPESYHYAPFLNMYAEKKKLDEAEKMFEEYQKSGLKLNEVMLNSMIKVYLSCNFLEKAAKLFEDMPSLYCPRGEVTNSIMIDAYCKAGLVEKAWSLFEDLKLKQIYPGNHIYSILISTYAKMGNVELVTSLYKDLESRKEAHFDVFLFNTVLKSFCELGLMDRVMNTLKKMNKESVAPDRSTFNILICFFCKQGMLDIALHTLDDLKARKFRPNQNSYALLISGLADSGKVDEASKLLVELTEYGLQPIQIVWNSVLDALCRENRLHEVLAHFKAMNDLKLLPSPSCLQSILVLAGKDEDILYEVLSHCSIGSNVLREVNLAIILSTYKKRGFHASMHKLLDYVKKENITVGNNEECEELITNLKQDAELEILSKLTGCIS